MNKFILLVVAVLAFGLAVGIATAGATTTPDTLPETSETLPEVTYNRYAYYPEPGIYVVHLEKKWCVENGGVVTCHFDIVTLQNNFFNNTAIITYDRRVSDRLVIGLPKN